MLKEVIEEKLIDLQTQIKKQSDIITESSQLIEKSANDKAIAINNMHVLNGAVQAYQDTLNSLASCKKVEDFE